MPDPHPPQLTSPQPDPPLLTGGRRVLALLIAVNVAVELVLQGADHHLWGSTLWRGQAYQNGGFWAGLLVDWHPNYPGQPVAMFLTYSLLHADLGHLIGNMLSLGFLGDMVLIRLQARGLQARDLKNRSLQVQGLQETGLQVRGGSGHGLLLLYAVSSLGGALVFGLLSHSPAPMIGASGAIFGLAGALTVWDAQDRRATGVRGRASLIIAGLAGLNLFIWWSAAGNLAWQTHLGGFASGALLALYAPRFLVQASL